MRGSEPFVDGLCFTDVQSVFRELEEVESVLGEAEDIVENSWGGCDFFFIFGAVPPPSRRGGGWLATRRSSMLANRQSKKKGIHER